LDYWIDGFLDYWVVWRIVFFCALVPLRKAILLKKSIPRIWYFYERVKSDLRKSGSSNSQISKRKSGFTAYHGLYKTSVENGAKIHYIIQSKMN
jgi:hypothetical protein